MLDTELERLLLYAEDFVLWLDVGLGDREYGDDTDCDAAVVFVPDTLDDAGRWMNFGRERAEHVASSDRLDCSDTPLSHVSYSASDCDSDGVEHWERSSSVTGGDSSSERLVEPSVRFLTLVPLPLQPINLLPSFSNRSSGGGGVTSFSSSCNWSMKHLTERGNIFIQDHDL